MPMLKQNKSEPSHQTGAQNQHDTVWDVGVHSPVVCWEDPSGKSWITYPMFETQARTFPLSFGN
jgi:hypothetical protein